MNILALINNNRMFWNAPLPMSAFRTNSKWQPTFRAEPVLFSKKVVLKRLADYTYLRSFRTTLPEINAVRIQSTFTVHPVKLDMEGHLLMANMRLRCPRSLMEDFYNVILNKDAKIPGYAVKRSVGLGKRIMSEYCRDALHGSVYSFVDDTDAVAIRLLNQDAQIINLKTLEKV